MIRQEVALSLVVHHPNKFWNTARRVNNNNRSNNDYSSLSSSSSLWWIRRHQQHCRSNIVECYKLNDSFDKVECCFDIVAVFWRLCCWFRQQCWMKFHAFYKVETNWTCSICFDFAEGKFRSTLLPKPATLLPKTATMSKQHSTLSKARNLTINSCGIVAFLAT